MAIGAQKQHVLRLVLGRGFLLTIIGLGLGLFGAVAVTRVLQDLLFEVGPTDPLTFVAVPVSLALATLLACWIPARKATRIDPIIVLRSE
jgi:ABC-type antimicrobial peptide transport system permease subunit